VLVFVENFRNFYSSPLSLFGEPGLGEETRQAIAPYEQFRKKILLATSHRQAGQASFRLLHEAIELFPRNAVVQETLIRDYDAKIKFLQTKRGKKKELIQAYQEKIKVYQSILTHDNGRSVLHRDLGWAYRKLGELFLAEVELRKALVLDDTDSISHRRLGVIYGMQKRYPLAEKEFLLAIDLNPKNYSAYNDLATLFRLQGDKNKAAEALRKSLEIYPDQQDIRKTILELEKDKIG